MKRNVLRTLIAGTAAAAMVLGSMGCFAEETEAVTETDAAEAEAVTETGGSRDRSGCRGKGSSEGSGDSGGELWHKL